MSLIDFVSTLDSQISRIVVKPLGDIRKVELRTTVRVFWLFDLELTSLRATCYFLTGTDDRRRGGR